MADQSFLARLGARLGTLGSASVLAFAAPLAADNYDVAAHTSASRIGFYFDRTAAAEKMGFVVMGTERLAVSVTGAGVNGDLIVSGSGNISATGVVDSAYGGGSTVRLQGTATDGYVGTIGGYNLKLMVNGSPKATVYQSGGLYVGSFPSDPGANNLQVQGTIYVQSGQSINAVADNSYISICGSTTTLATDARIEVTGRSHASVPNQVLIYGQVNLNNATGLRALTSFASTGVYIGGSPVDPGVNNLTVQAAGFFGTTLQSGGLFTSAGLHGLATAIGSQDIQGYWIGWNENTGSGVNGQTVFRNHRGLGAGGFDWVDTVDGSMGALGMHLTTGGGLHVFGGYTRVLGITGPPVVSSNAHYQVSDGWRIIRSTPADASRVWDLLAGDTSLQYRVVDGSYTEAMTYMTVSRTGNTDASVRFDTATGVSIGMAAAGAPNSLSVAGNLRVQGSITVGGTSNANQIIEGIHDSQLIAMRSASTSGTARIQAQAAGYWSTPTYQGVAIIQVGPAVATTGSYVSGIADAGMGVLQFQNNATASCFVSNTSVPFVFAPGGADRMRLYYSGGLYVGSSPNDPGANNLQVQSTTYTGISFRRSGLGYADPGGNGVDSAGDCIVLFYGLNQDSRIGIDGSAGTWFKSINSGGGGNFKFYVGSANTLSIQLCASGGVYVGTSPVDPGANNLAVQGNIGIGTTPSGVATEKFRYSDGTRTVSGGCDTNQPWFGSSSDHDLRLLSNNAERVRIKATGQVRFVPLASAPGGAENGDVYYDSTTNKLRVYAAGAWVDLH